MSNASDPRYWGSEKWWLEWDSGICHMLGEEKKGEKGSPRREVFGFSSGNQLWLRLIAGNNPTWQPLVLNLKYSKLLKFFKIKIFFKNSNIQKFDEGYYMQSYLGVCLGFWNLSFPHEFLVIPFFPPPIFLPFLLLAMNIWLFSNHHKNEKKKKEKETPCKKNPRGNEEIKWK